MAVCRLVWRAGLLLLLAWLVAASPAAAAFERSSAAAALLAATDVPEGFQETTALSGLTQPTAVRFAADGRIVVAEKSGRVKLFDGFGDPTPELYADLSQNVHDYWDRGLLGLELDPEFTTGRPYVYVLYAYNKAPNSSQVPRWPDSCPNPPGGTGDGCVVTGRLSVLNGGVERVLIEDWCQQYPSHSIGSLAFGRDGALYVSGGEGASFEFADWGQRGSPRNPCGDPPVPVGSLQQPPDAQGGALRSQDVRTGGDPTGLGGTILRVDPDTGDALPDNPNAGSSDPNTRRIVAYGLRNPFRITVRPGTDEVWSGDVGWRLWEEINRIPSPTGPMRNFGWPCYEGTGRNGDYDAADLTLCESLYQQGAGAHAAPHYTYDHRARVVTGESCSFGSSSISGLAFTPAASSFPARYDGALFFSDYSRRCIWAMLAGAGGVPDPSRIETFAAQASGPVELRFGPGGDLYYVDIGGGTIRRIRALNTNRAPVARATATPSTGQVPLTVQFDGRGSSDPENQPLTYAWDLDGDGAFDDSTASTPTWTYQAAGTFTARLRVTDPALLTDVVNVPIRAGNPPVPTITISSPAPGERWRVNDTISFSGSAVDAAGDPIPASGLTWDINLHHCDRDSGSCHIHQLQSFAGVASGSFPGPDHAYPSSLEIELTARDSAGLTGVATRRLDPRTAQLTLRSQPPGVRIAHAGETSAAPFTREVIQRSTNSLAVESPQTLFGVPHLFTGWSHGGARIHSTVVETDTTLTVTFAPSTARRMAGADWVGPEYPPSVAPPGVAEVYKTTADHPGTATELRLYVHHSSTATALVMGLYADAGGEPGALLGSGRMALPAPGAWNKVDVDIPGIQAGRDYWIGLLNPSDSTGMLRWRDAADASESPERQSDATDPLAALPGTWATESDKVWSGGPVSAYVWGPPPPALGVTPASLSFSGSGSSTLSVVNAAGGALTFTASDDAPWLSVTPAAGSAPAELTVTVASAGLAPGTHTATVRVDSAGGTRAIPVTLTLPSPPSSSPPSSSPPSSSPPSPPPPGPVGAWGFDEARGRTARDSGSGGNRGRIAGAVRTRGRFGGGLAFDGRNDWVTVRDSPALDPRRAMTLEAWVRPAARGARSVLVKQRGRGLAYGLYARPSAHLFTGAERALRARPALRRNRWAHLAMTWDGRTMRVYVDGAVVAAHRLGGRVRASRGPLRIGGNAVWPEFFKGVIDEVRVYDRALTASEIARDRATPVNPGVARRKAAKHRGGGRTRRTLRGVHRGTRWLSGGCAAARSG